MSVRIQVDIDAGYAMSVLDLLPSAAAAEGEKAMETAVHIVEAEVKALTPRKTGRLFAGWETHVHGLGFHTTGIVANKVPYAAFVEQGTGPHEIVAHGQALRWVGSDGKYVFRKRVLHPGFFGRHMALFGLAAAKDAVVDTFRRAMKDAVQIALRK